MAKEIELLQSIKLDISRSFKLNPYERIAFHKILAINKSAAGVKILIKELGKGEEIRRSAISALKVFDSPEVLEILANLLNNRLTKSEYINILEYIYAYGDDSNILDLIIFIDSKREEYDFTSIIVPALNALGKVGQNSNDVYDYLVKLINDPETNSELKSAAVINLTSFKDVSLFEKLLKEGDDLIAYSVFRGIYLLNIQLLDDAAVVDLSDEEKLYTYNQDEDKIVLDIRVLLGKFSSKFDSYSNRTKVAYINASMSCNHREYIIYIMKALTSEDSDLITLTLYAVYVNITNIKNPDKLLRNLIAISTEKRFDDELIVDIFEKYFSSDKNTPQFNILKDKLYGYIIVTFESYFETFRKEFMIKEVIEKGYSKNFQKIRRVILDRMTPDLKRNISSFLCDETPATINHIISDMSKWISYIDESEKNDLYLLLEVLLYEDEKSRENSAAKINEINFEKRYLKSRIVRLCQVISKLNIVDAASQLVNIYNYLKKYPDEEIISEVMHTLSNLNYSYMLGEIEVQLTTGTDNEKRESIELLSLFMEQRSLNILMDFLLENTLEEHENIKFSLTILLSRDIKNNLTANHLFKTIIENNANDDIIEIAILGLGHCNMESDIAYLNELFYNIEKKYSKEAIVRSLSLIVSNNIEINKRKMVKFFQEFLKDPGIKVRIYSCLILIKMGNKDALRVVREMLVIKNKSVQRDILSIISEVDSIEFSFFLISLLTEEYGIVKDVIPVFQLLSRELALEIENFIINIFRKNEAPEIEGFESDKTENEIKVSNLTLSFKTVLIINLDIKRLIENIKTDIISIILLIKSFMSDKMIDKESNIVEFSNNRFVAIFANPEDAIQSAIKINNGLKRINRKRNRKSQINISIQIISDDVRMINQEVLEIPEFEIEKIVEFPIENKIIIDGSTYEKVKDIFEAESISDLLFTKTSNFNKHYKVKYLKNFISLCEENVKEIQGKEREKKKLESQIQNELKKLKSRVSSTSGAAIAGELENIGIKLLEELNEIEKYVQRRSTDMELVRNVRKMLTNVNNVYKVEISRIMLE